MQHNAVWVSHQQMPEQELQARLQAWSRLLHAMDLVKPLLLGPEQLVLPLLAFSAGL